MVRHHGPQDETGTAMVVGMPVVASGQLGDTGNPHTHTWEEGQEVTFEDLTDGTGHGKTGYNKIRFCGQQAELHGLKYFWVDTYCIDKSNKAEEQYNQCICYFTSLTCFGDAS